MILIRVIGLGADVGVGLVIAESMQGPSPTGDQWRRPRPEGASIDAIRVLAARGVRAFGDGFVALLLPIYLLDLGFSAFARSRAPKAVVQPSSYGSEQEPEQSGGR